MLPEQALAAKAMRLRQNQRVKPVNGEFDEFDEFGERHFTLDRARVSALTNFLEEFSYV
jgi:hypothetical protein